ncbi:MAG: rubredoxin-like domain-containing protein [Candidatus Cryosericum sp.]
MWRCMVCGLVFEGEEPPQVCPKCGAPAEKFEPISDDQAKIIARARKTNQLHSDLLAAVAKVEAIANAGIDDNLDPPCVKVFTAAREAARLVRQLGVAEIQAHVNKGKWG